MCALEASLQVGLVFRRLRVGRKRIKADSGITLESKSPGELCGQDLLWLVSCGSASWWALGGEDGAHGDRQASPASMDMEAHSAAVYKPFALGQVLGNRVSHLIFHTHLNQAGNPFLGARK